MLALAAAYGDGEPVANDDEMRARAERQIIAWGERRGATRDIHDLGSRHVARRIAGIVSKAHAHRRPMLAAMAARARRAATLPLGVGAASALGVLAEADMEDEAWLRAMGAFADAYGDHPSDPGVDILAMLLFHQ